MMIFDLVKLFAVAFSLLGVFIIFYVFLGSSSAIFFVLIALSMLFLPVYVLVCGAVSLVNRIKENKRGGR